MRGKSPNNHPEVRKRWIFDELQKHDGEIRWTELKNIFSKRKMGPTTLKKTLDVFVNEGLIFIEPRYEQGRPSVWYVLSITPDETLKRLKESPLLRGIIELQEKLIKASDNGSRQKAILDRELAPLIMSYSVSLAGALIRCINEKEEKISQELFLYINDTILLDHAAALLALCREYPEFMSDLLPKSIEKIERTLA